MLKLGVGVSPSPGLRALQVGAGVPHQGLSLQSQALTPAPCTAPARLSRACKAAESRVPKNGLRRAAEGEWHRRKAGF